MLDPCPCGKYMKKQNKARQVWFFSNWSMGSGHCHLTPVVLDLHRLNTIVRSVKCSVWQREHRRGWDMDAYHKALPPLHYPNCAIHWRLSFCLMIWEEGIWNPNQKIKISSIRRQKLPFSESNWEMLLLIM